MSNVAMKAAHLMDMLPENDQNFAYEFIKKLVLAWDPDYTKLTVEEAQQLEDAAQSGCVDDSEIDWSTVGC